jgi:2-oxoglutarate ferredoxin oxidoreductase subunit gamma
VTYIPVYGPEMRGGTANCTVVLSEEDIGSPIIRTPVSLIVMNRPSLEKFEPRLADGGVQVINSSLVDPELAEKNRVKNVFVPANDIADKLGNTRMANMVALGAYVRATGVMPVEAVQEALPDVISKRYEKMIPKNAEALAAGAEHAAKQ